MGKFTDRLKHGWNAFVDQEPIIQSPQNFDIGSSYGVRPDRLRSGVANERSIISSIYNRIAVDVAAVDIRHVKLDDQDRFTSYIDSGLDSCLRTEANLDQSARAFRQDICATLFEHGSAAIVPVDTTLDPTTTAGFDIKTLRVGVITEWFPRHVRVSLYNEATGRREDLILEKKFVAIVENPFYSVMNEPNSTLQRLLRKLKLLDAIDSQSSSGKLDIIIQLPYQLKSEAKQQQADNRKLALEAQLKDSKYGIAYTDSTEKITQLNRPAENNMMAQVQYLMDVLRAELGITDAIMNGTADEATMLNYNNRTVEPILGAIAEAMIRTFLTKTARSQKQDIQYFRDPFKLVPMKDIAELADKLTRNEIVSANEFRSFIGLKPSNDPNADRLINSNMPAEKRVDSATSSDNTAIMDDAFAEVNRQLDEVFASLGGEPDSG